MPAPSPYHAIVLANWHRRRLSDPDRMRHRFGDGAAQASQVVAILCGVWS